MSMTKATNPETNNYFKIDVKGAREALSFFNDRDPSSVSKAFDDITNVQARVPTIGEICVYKRFSIAGQWQGAYAKIPVIGENFAPSAYKVFRAAGET